MRNREARLLLLDKAVAALPLRPVAAAIWQQRVNAHRYRFDIEASKRVGELLRDCIDLLVDNIEFARTPFPTCYFELNARAMWEVWRAEQPYRDTADELVGFLVHKGSVLVMATGNRPNTIRDLKLPEAMVCGMCFRINHPQSRPFAQYTGVKYDPESLKQAYVFGGQRMIKVAPSEEPVIGRFGRTIALTTEEFRHRWEGGISLPTIGEHWTHEQIAGHFDVFPAFTAGDETNVREMCFLGGGDPMTLVAMLLLINQPSRYIALEHVARERGLWKGKLYSFKEHHVVTMKLDRDRKVRDMFHTTDRASPIRHPVSGHWKHYNKSQNCHHHFDDGRQAWEPIGADRTDSGEYKRFWCSLCLQRRTWVDSFMAGSGGHATTEHEVKG